jgi:penicillin-binding protein 2
MKITRGLFLTSLFLAHAASGADPMLLRGSITDRKGEVLAESREIRILQFVPSPAGDREIDAAAVATALLAQFHQRTGLEPKVSAEKLAKHLAQNGRLAMSIEPPLDETTAQAITAAGLENWRVVSDSRRHYPGQTLAAHIIGYVGRNRATHQDEGRFGLEAAQDAGLNRGRRVTTTIDLAIQRQAEKLLAEKDRPGAIVVLEPATGEVLALASWPSFDLNQFVPAISLPTFRALQEDIHAPLLARPYQIAATPGSAFHVFSGLCALRDGKLTVEESLKCEPTTAIGGVLFRNWNDTTATLNFSQAVSEVHHGFFYQTVPRMEGARFHQLLGDFGFGRKTGLGLPSESAGRLDEQPIDPRAGALANAAIGQGQVSVTPLQLAQATNVLAHGGIFTPTRLILRTSDVDGGNAQENALRKTAEPIISQTALQAAVTGMQSAMENRLRVLPKETRWTAAGVTGSSTYEQRIGEDKVRLQRGTFAGFAPVEQPQFTVVVMLEECAGGRDAAILAARLMRQIVKEK